MHGAVGRHTTYARLAGQGRTDASACERVNQLAASIEHDHCPQDRETQHIPTPIGEQSRPADYNKLTRANPCLIAFSAVASIVRAQARILIRILCIPSAFGNPMPV
jgi:hypothetical protein